MNEIIERKSWFLSVMPWKLKMFFVCCGNQLKRLIDNNIRATQIFQSHRKLLGQKYQTYRLVPRLLIMTHWEVFIKLSTINLNIFFKNIHEEEQLGKTADPCNLVVKSPLDLMILQGSGSYDFIWLLFSYL